MKNLFTYGTLMCEEIMHIVTDDHYPRQIGYLAGFSRFAVKGQTYPALIRDPASGVEGILYQNISNLAWRRLELFEGEMYQPQQISVRLNNGQRISAETFVCRPEYQDRLTDCAWDFADFLRQGKAEFIKYYPGYNKL